MASFALSCVLLLALLPASHSSPTTLGRAFLESLMENPEPELPIKRVICDYCQDLIPNLKYFFVDNATGVAVLEAVYKYCILFSDDTAAQALCYGLLGRTWMYIYQVLDVSSKDNSLCKRLTLCDYPNAPFIPVDPKLLAESCVLFVQSFQPTILANTTLPRLQHIVNNFCPDFPTPEEKQRCQKFASTGLPVLYQTVADAVKDPGNTCANILSSQILPVSLTFQNQPTNLGRLPQYVPGDSSCDTCKLWAQVLKPIFSNNNLLNQLTKSFHSFCDSLGFPVFFDFLQSNQSVVLCRTLFDNFVPMTWRLLGQEMTDPEKFCVKFTLCYASQPEVDEKKTNFRPHNSDLCKACQFFADFIKPLVLANFTLTRLTTAAANLCSTMPLTSMAGCEVGIAKLVNEAYDIVEEYFKSNTTCTELIGICGSSQSGPPHAQTPVIIDEDSS